MLALVMATEARSGGIPVFDGIADFTRGQQLQQAIDQVATSEAMRDTLALQYAALVGSRGFGALLPEGLRSLMPGSDAGIARVLAGLPGAGAAGGLARRLQEQFPLEVDGPEVASDANGNGNGFHNRRVRASQGAEALARIAYLEIERDLAMLRSMTGAIASADDPKAALELQARLMAQNAKSVLITARMLALAEITRARVEASHADRARLVRGLVAPNFVNPRIGG